MRPLTEDENKAVFEKLANYIGKNVVHLVDRQDDAHCFRLHKGRVYYVSEASMRLSISVARSNLLSLGTCLGKFSKSGKFKLHITSLDYLAQYARYKVWVKPNGEMPFLYGNHVLKAHLGRITEDTPEHQGVVLYSMNDVPLGFGVTSKSTVDTRKLDPTAIVVFHQADVGEYLRDEWLDVSDNELDTSIINDVLGAITDDLWVVAAVADRIIDNPSLLHDLLGIALKRSQSIVERLRNSFAFQDPQEICASGGQDSSSVYVDEDMVSYFRENASDARICVLRSVLLDRKDRVETFMEMSAVNVAAHGESEAPAEWDDDPWIDADPESDQQPSQRPLPLSLSTFLSQSLVDSACLLATRESFGSLQILFKRHGSSIWPYRLTILAFIPTHLSPLCYQEFLPKLDLSLDEEFRSPVDAWRPELDWTENLSVQVALSTSGHDAPQSRLSTHSADEAPQPMSSQELALWYRRQIQTILGSTGMVDVALSMVQHAASQGILELDELGEELSLLSRLVYDAQAAAEDGPEDDWTLEQWKSMDSLAVIHAMLALSTPQTLLNDFILGAPLGIVARIFEDSKPTLPLRHRLISDNEDMARLALACLYGSNIVDEWHIMSQIFECLPDWSGASGDEDFEDAVEMTITSLGTYVTPTTARPTCTPSDLYVFFRPLPLPSLSRALDILDSSNDKNSQRARAVRMARRPGTNHALHGQSDWEWLLEDMLKLCRTNDNGLRGAFGLLSQAEILSIFLSGLLSTGRKADIAKNLLRSKKSTLSLDDRVVEEICLTSSREFYDNASSGNYNFGDMKLAYDCLSIPVRSETIIREQEFIEATSRIASFNVETRPGIPLSPIENSSTNSVSRRCSPPREGVGHDCGHCTPAEDFAQAFETSETMIDTVSHLCSSPGISQAELNDAKEVCWVSCFQLGRQTEFANVEKKLRLLGHALEFCPADRLPEILMAWRRLERRVLRCAAKAEPRRRRRRPTWRHCHQCAASDTSAGCNRTVPSVTVAEHTPSRFSPRDGGQCGHRGHFQSRCFKFPFSKSRPQAHSSQSEGDNQGQSRGEDVGWPSLDREEVSSQASKALQRGIGWLIGADE
ncbi:hypothetical protein BJV77DRAFT_1146898 [Russula vinacea]|nr:hypothetical protein BJV77DRAFT_1146898 [Russula vinacea]